MKFEDKETLTERLQELCAHYKIPNCKRPCLRFYGKTKDEMAGFYFDWDNEIWIYSRLTMEEALATLRHEFGHFMLFFRDPKRKFHKREETIAKMMERTLLPFPHLVKSTQKPLDIFIKAETTEP